MRVIDHTISIGTPLGAKQALRAVEQRLLENGIDAKVKCNAMHKDSGGAWNADIEVEVGPEPLPGFAMLNSAVLAKLLTY